MTTKRYALDNKNCKIFIGNIVKYNNKTFLVEDIEYLSWTTRQWLTLIDKKNRNKKIRWVLSNDVSVNYAMRHK